MQYCYMYFFLHRYLIKGQASLEVVNSQATMNETVFVRDSGFVDWQTSHLNLYTSENYQVQNFFSLKKFILKYIIDE